MGALVQLQVDEIVVNPAISVREGLDEETIQTYMQCYDDLPPIEVWELSDRGGVKMLVDGFHRNAARERLGRTTCTVRLFTGTWAQAHERSIVANVRHGRHYTVAERRQAAREMLKLHPDWADNYIVQLLGKIVTAPTIKALRSEMATAGEIPLHDRLLGADGKWRPREYEPGAEEEPAPPRAIVLPRALSPARCGGNGQPVPDTAPPPVAWAGPPETPAGAATADDDGDGAEAGQPETALFESGEMPRLVPTLAPTAPAPLVLPPRALLVQANAMHLPLADESVHVEVVSPPYYSQRVYAGVEPTVWGGDPSCEHEWTEVLKPAADGTLREEGNAAFGHSWNERPARLQARKSLLCAKCGAWWGLLGLEPTLDLYVQHLAAILNGEAWRVLRPDGTLWLNLGNAYAGSWGEHKPHHQRVTRRPGRNADRPVFAEGWQPSAHARQHGLRAGDLLAVPWRVGLALQGFAVLSEVTLTQWADWLQEARAKEDWSVVEMVEQRLRQATLVEALQQGGRWRLRSEIIWAKSVSGQRELTRQVYAAALAQGVREEQAQALVAALDPYVGSCMPESVSGVRWERHRQKCPDRQRIDHTDCPHCSGEGLVPCPGCRRCEPYGGYVPCWGNWRPTSSFEVVLLFAKGPRYFCDGEAVKEEATNNPDWQHQRAATNREKGCENRNGQDGGFAGWQPGPGRNLRSVWTITSRRYGGDHYAAFPPMLPELCIKAGTSEAGVCPRCGAPWARVIERSKPVVGSDIPVATRASDSDLNAASSRSRTSALRVSNSANYTRWRAEHPDQTLGFYPTCNCRADNGDLLMPVPATVLDFFCGTATTGQVATDLGRNFVGVDMSYYYLDQQARVRLAGGGCVGEMTTPRSSRCL